MRNIFAMECRMEKQSVHHNTTTHLNMHVRMFLQTLTCSIAANISTGEWRLWTKIYWLVGGRTPYVIFNKGVFYTKKKPLQKG